MTQTAKQIAQAAGYHVARGAYHGTTDDRADRWYVAHNDDEMIDRRGDGYRTQREAWEAAAEHAAEMADWAALDAAASAR